MQEGWKVLAQRGEGVGISRCPGGHIHLDYGQGMMLNPGVEAAAREFALKLRASPPIAAFWEAKARLEADKEAQGLLTELQQRQQALMLKQQNGGNITQEEIDALRRLQGEAQRNPVIMGYVQAQQQAQAFLSEVNMEISQLLGFDFGGLAGAGGG